MTKATPTLLIAERPNSQERQPVKKSVDLVTGSREHHDHDDVEELEKAVAAGDKDKVFKVAKKLVALEAGTDNPLPQLVSVEEIAMKFNLCTRSIWRLVGKGDLPQPIHVGSARRWYASDIESYLKKLAEKRDGIQRRRRG